MKGSIHWESMKNFGEKSKILLDKQMKTQMILMGNIYMKIKLNLDDDIPHKTKLQFYDMIIVVRSVFHKSNNYYSQTFLDVYLYKLA